jgi:hypothetical protein
MNVPSDDEELPLAVSLDGGTHGSLGVGWRSKDGAVALRLTCLDCCMQAVQKHQQQEYLKRKLLQLRSQLLRCHWHLCLSR